MFIISVYIMTDTKSSLGQHVNVCVGKEYILVSKIGEGSFGEVYIAQSKASSRRVAVKLVRFASLLGKHKQRTGNPPARSQSLQTPPRLL